MIPAELQEAINRDLVEIDEILDAHERVTSRPNRAWLWPRKKVNSLPDQLDADSALLVSRQ